MENYSFDRLNSDDEPSELRKRQAEASKEAEDAKKLKAQAEKEAKKAKEEAEKEAEKTPKKGWLAEFFDKQKEKDEAKKAKEEAEKEAEAVKETAEEVEETAEKTADTAEAIEEAAAADTSEVSETNLANEAEEGQAETETSNIEELTGEQSEESSADTIELDIDKLDTHATEDEDTEASIEPPEVAIHDGEDEPAESRETIAGRPFVEGTLFDRHTGIHAESADKDAAEAKAEPIDADEVTGHTADAEPVVSEGEVSLDTDHTGESAGWGDYGGIEESPLERLERSQTPHTQPEKVPEKKSEGIPVIGGFLVGLLVGRRRAMNKIKTELAELNKELQDTNIELEKAQDDIRSLQMKQAASGNTSHIAASSELAPDQQFASKTVGAVTTVGAISSIAAQNHTAAETIREANQHKAWAVDTLPVPEIAVSAAINQSKRLEKNVPIEKLPIEEQVKRYRVSDREYLPHAAPDWLRKLHERVRERAPLPEVSVWQMEYLKRKYPELHEAVERIREHQRPLDSAKASQLGKRGIEAAQESINDSKIATMSQVSDEYTVSLPYREEIKKNSGAKTGVLATIVILATAIATMYLLSLR